MEADAAQVIADAIDNLAGLVLVGFVIWILFK